jgi:hypothetical protein
VLQGEVEVVAISAGERIQSLVEHHGACVGVGHRDSRFAAGDASIFTRIGSNGVGCRRIRRIGSRQYRTAQRS